MASHYSITYYESNGQANDRPALLFYTRVAKAYFQKGRVLDFGSGTGFFLKRMSGHFTVDGFEISEEGRRRSRELLPQLTVYQRLDEIPAQRYVGITALHVLEHIPDDLLREVLASWKRALLPGGRVLCVIPEVNGKGHQLKKDCWSGFRDPTHINLKSREEWKNFFTKNGFAVVKAGADGLWDFPYKKEYPRLLDFALHAPATVLQYLLGRMVLREGGGESLILLVEPVPITAPF